jgi:hypothetical protein
MPASAERTRTAIDAVLTGDEDAPSDVTDIQQDGA